MKKTYRKELFRMLWDGDDKGLTEYTARQLRKTIRCCGEHDDFYHAFLAGLFSNRDYIVASNPRPVHGQPDLLILDGYNNRAAVIELKHAETAGQLAGALEEVLSQGRCKDYTEALAVHHPYCPSVSLWGMAVYKKICLLKVEDITEKFSMNSDEQFS